MLVRLLIWIDSLLRKLERKVVAEKNSRTLKELKYCGEGVRLVNRAKIVSPENIEICNNVHIGDNAYLDGRGGITIGENTHISRNFVVHSSSHNYLGARLPYDDTYSMKPVIIERNVWIGTNVVVVPGVRIGEGAILGAGAVVTKTVPSLAIVGNQTERVIKYRDNLHYQKLIAENAYGGISGRAIEKELE